MTSLIIFWFRNDLRLSDNPGFFQVAAKGVIMPIYIFDEEGAEPFKMGSASRWWLHHSLTSLNCSLQQKLNIYSGSTQEVFKKLLSEHKIQEVYWSRCYELSSRKQETDVVNLLQQHKIKFQSFNASLLWEPSEILKKDNKPYQIFTPFYRQAISQ
ncbi:unnamed protein product, partial [Sphagnum compactum]